MGSQVLEPKKQELEDFIQGNPDAREVKRALAVKWSWLGISFGQFRKLLNLSLEFIIKWNKKISPRGVNGLKIAYKGKPSYLSQSDKEEIIKKVKSEGNVGFGTISYPYKVKI
jgi:transposase